MIEDPSVGEYARVFREQDALSDDRLPRRIGAALEGFGGVLRCETCGRTIEMLPGDAGLYTSSGWPRCCGYTMRWWTQRQIDAGEMT